MRTSLAIAGVLVALLTGCGPTIGDPCTTANECAGALCVNRDYAPGGYCSQACRLDQANSCPTGSICVRDALGKNSPACFRTCNLKAECRSGYVCRSENGSANICVGPIGF